MEEDDEMCRLEDSPPDLETLTEKAQKVLNDSQELIHQIEAMEEQTFVEIDVEVEPPETVYGPHVHLEGGLIAEEALDALFNATFTDPQGQR